MNLRTTNEVLNNDNNGLSLSQYHKYQKSLKAMNNIIIAVGRRVFGFYSEYVFQDWVQCYEIDLREQGLDDNDITYELSLITVLKSSN